MKAATLEALLRGDIENAIIAETPGSIEAQETRGQRDFVASETLPIECNHCSREQLEQMGILFGDPIDDLFVAVQLPKGWKKVPTDHSMWSQLLDGKERERAVIFYKAAFYDRSAHISLTRRFYYSVEPICGYDNSDYRNHEWHCVVKDCEQIAWESEQRLEPEPQYQHSDEEGRLVKLDWYDDKDALSKLGEAWLEEHYPDWRNPLAYWDLP